MIRIAAQAVLDIGKLLALGVLLLLLVCVAVVTSPLSFALWLLLRGRP